MSTTEIKTQNGHTVVIKNFITYGEHNRITEIYLDDSIPKPEAHKKVDKLGVELVVVSIDGKTEDMYALFCDLPLGDANEVAKKMEEVLRPKAGGNS